MKIKGERVYNEVEHELRRLHAGSPYFFVDMPMMITSCCTSMRMMNVRRNLNSLKFWQINWGIEKIRGQGAKPRIKFS